MLRSSGFVTECYGSAIEFARQHSPDVIGCVLADLRMLDMDGIALQAHLARRERIALAHRRALQARLDTLTPREEQVLSHVIKERLNKQMAAELGIDERSVKRHRSHLMRKLGVTSVAELAQLVLEAGGRLDPEPPLLEQSSRRQRDWKTI
nr:LuxR C-terminal-related transcriptional regulator [Thiorhodococcus mannitoliphagus]